MKQLFKYYTRFFIGLFPIFFLPFLTEPYGLGKNWLLMASAFLGMVIWAVIILTDKKIKIKYSKSLIFFFLFTLWSLWSWGKMSVGGRTSSLFNSFGLGTIISLCAWMFLLLQVNSKEEKKKQVLALTLSGVVLAIFSLILFILPESRLPINTSWISITKGWSLTGTLIGEVFLFLFLAIEYLKRMLVSIKKSESYIKEALLTVVFSLVLFLGIYKLFSFGMPILSGYTSWVIAVDTLKGNLVEGSSFFGVGPGNFLVAFNLFKPAVYNLSPYWATGFLLSGMGWLHLWTELGLVGLAFSFALVSTLIKNRKSKDFIRLLLFVLAFLFLPLNLILVFLLMFLMVGLAEKKEVSPILEVGETRINIMPYVIGILLLAGGVFGSYLCGRFFMGDMYVKKSMVAASKDDGKATYDYQLKAISLSPRMPAYFQLNSRTSLAIAATILQNEESTDDDKETASKLIQQAVDQAKAAISLNRLDSSNWLTLADTYRQLIGVVEGTADWALQAYQQAVNLNPTNPAIKLDMGGLLFAAGNYEEADRVFEEVVTDKNDYANAWYNWAYTAKQLNRVDYAVVRLEQALRLVPQDSGDYEQADKELTEWKKELDELIKQQQAQLAAQQQQQQQQEQKEPETFKVPEPLPTVGEEELVDVPAEELEPPIEENIE
jgi:tetratricopeptide (TPR) repeat protein